MIKISPYKYRVLQGAEEVFGTNELDAAITVFNELLPKNVIIVSGKHIVTHEPLIEARDSRSRQLRIVLYGVEWKVWKEMSI